MTSDPYPFCRRLRDESPVARARDLGRYLVCRHDDVVHVERDPVNRPLDPLAARRVRALTGSALTPAVASTPSFDLRTFAMNQVKPAAGAAEWAPG